MVVRFLTVASRFRSRLVRSHASEHVPFDHARDPGTLAPRIRDAETRSAQSSRSAGIVATHWRASTQGDIRHPEMAYVTATQVMIAFEMSEENLPDKVVFSDPVHITRIEPLRASSTLLERLEYCLSRSGTTG